MDTETGETLQWFREHQFPSEPTFIPRPAAEGEDPESLREDDGVLLSLVMAGDRDVSYLIAIDCLTWEVIATVSAPRLQCLLYVIVFASCVWFIWQCFKSMKVFEVYASV